MRIAPRYIQKRLSDYDNNLTIEWTGKTWMICEDGEARFEYLDGKGKPALDIDGCGDDIIRVIRKSDKQAGLIETKERWNANRVLRKNRAEKASYNKKEDSEKEISEIVNFGLKGSKYKRG